MFSQLQVSTMGVQSGVLQGEHQQRLLSPSELVDQRGYVRVQRGSHRAHAGQGGLKRLAGQRLENMAPVQTVLILYAGVCKVSGALF